METEKKDTYVCPTCGNTDPKYIGYKNGHPYCRKCIAFKGEEADNIFTSPKRAYFKLNYELSEDQKRLSDKLITNYKKGINTLVHAVCGSGKTEIVLLQRPGALAEGKRLSARHLPCRTGPVQKNTGLFQDQVLREHGKIFSVFPISHGRRILLLPVR